MTLSPCELAVLELVSQGKTDKEMMEILGVRGNTVSKELTNVYKKLGAVNRPHAVRIAFEFGILRLPVCPYLVGRKPECS